MLFETQQRKLSKTKSKMFDVFDTNHLISEIKSMYLRSSFLIALVKLFQISKDILSS